MSKVGMQQRERMTIEILICKMEAKKKTLRQRDKERREGGGRN